MRLDLSPRWLDNLIDPHNPFVPWLLLLDLVLLVVHIFVVYWVYRDALWRYNRGAPWGLLAAVFPLGGWLFYLMYRKSPLVELDRIEAELFDEGEHEWTDYDDYKGNRGASLFKELTDGLLREGGEGNYSARVQLSRLRELGRRLTPEERRSMRELRAQRKAEARQARLERRRAAATRRRERKQERREATTFAGRHGGVYRLSDRGQRRLRSRLAVVEQLKAMPREDAQLEELIFEMEYDKARELAEGNLAVAREMNDPQGIVTYEAYLERLARLPAP